MDGTQRQLFTSAAVPTLHGPAGCSALHCLACAALLYDELVFVDRPRCCVLPLLGTHIEGGGGAAQRQVASAAAGFPRTRFVGVWRDLSLSLRSRFAQAGMPWAAASQQGLVAAPGACAMAGHAATSCKFALASCHCSRETLAATSS